MTQQEFNRRVVELLEDVLSAIPYSDENRRKKDALYSEISHLGLLISDIGRSADDE